MAEYSAEVLQRLHDVEVDMLDAFVQICNKYQIDYFLVHGTALGCVRHSGFIPWDDDIDVGMLQEDYNKLRLVPKSEWRSDLILCDPSDDNEKHFFPYPRLYKMGTKNIPESFSMLIERSWNNTGTVIDGIWIDIFIYHRVSSLESAVKIDKKIYRLRKEYLYSKLKKRRTKETSLRDISALMIENVFHNIINMMHSPEIKILNKYNSLFDNKGEYLTTYDPRPSGPSKNICLISEAFPLITMQFEGLEVKMLRNYDAVLRKIYGDYMKLPPPEKRHNHSPACLDFGDGQGNVVHV